MRRHSRRDVLIARALQHRRQVWGTAQRIDRSNCGPISLDIGGDFIEPIDKLGIAATTLDQMIEPVAIGAATLSQATRNL